jgi:hypothetical protein
MGIDPDSADTLRLPAGGVPGSRLRLSLRNNAPLITEILWYNVIKD